MKFTLAQAAIETGKDRSTLYRAIKKGKLSGELQEDKSYLIDSSELFRAYNKKINDDATQQCAQGQLQQPAQAELIDALRSQIEQLKEQAQRDREQIDREQAQADHWRQTAQMLLTHQPITETPPADPQKAQPKESPLWVKLFGRGTND